jgi:DNA-binding transcriptional regulator PaaX
MAKRVKTKQIAKTILLILGGGVALITLAAFPGLGYLINFLIKDKRLEGVSKKHIRSSLHYLKSRKYLVWNTKEDKVRIEISEKGKKKILEYQFEDMKIPKPERWDGKWRVVAFDIPEKKRIARDALRRKFKQLGFFKLQKSLFAYPYPCREEINLIAEIYEIQPCFIFIETSYIDKEKLLLKHFGLL